MSDGYSVATDVLSARPAMIGATTLVREDQRTDVRRCYCGEPLTPDGRCLNVGACSTADRRATRASLQRGTAASARPAAWQFGGRVD